jgi:hypothetical protein
MNEHDASPGPGMSDADAAASDRVGGFVTGVQALRVAQPTAARLERRLYWAGILLPVAGLIVIWLGWWGASGTKFVYQEIPYLISGGIVGVALVFIGAALFARYSVARLLRFWLARVIADHQTQTDRVVEALAALTEAVQGQAPVAERPYR